MSSVTGIVKALDHISGWVQAQLDAGVDATIIGTSQYEVMRAKLRNLKKIDFDAATNLINAINAAKVPWSNKELLDLVISVNHHLRSDAQKTAGKANQECPTFELYLTDDEMAKLGNPAYSNLAFANVCRKRAKLIGLFYASEGCKGRIAQIIKHVANKTDMNPTEWFCLLTTVKDALKTLRKEAWDFEHVTSYPLNPNDLPPPIYRHAYGGADAPGMHDLPGMDCPEFLRKSSRQLTARAATEVTKPQRQSLDTTTFATLFGPHIQAFLSQAFQGQQRMSEPNISYANQNLGRDHWGGLAPKPKRSVPPAGPAALTDGEPPNKKVKAATSKPAAKVDEDHADAEEDDADADGEGGGDDDWETEEQKLRASIQASIAGGKKNKDKKKAKPADDTVKAKPGRPPTKKPAGCHAPPRPPPKRPEVPDANKFDRKVRYRNAWLTQNMKKQQFHVKIMKRGTNVETTISFKKGRVPAWKTCLKWVDSKVAGTNA